MFYKPQLKVRKLIFRKNQHQILNYKLNYKKMTKRYKLKIEINFEQATDTFITNLRAILTQRQQNTIS